MNRVGTIPYGAALSAVFTAVALALGLRERRAAILVSAVLAAFVGPIGWNAILPATHAREFITDACTGVFPVSWQDTGSGIFTVAVGSILLGVFNRRPPAGGSSPGSRTRRLPRRHLSLLSSATGHQRGEKTAMAP
jgi:hypothetical protein